MAKGFATGLFHGVLVCGAALAALSLILPQPLQAPALVPEMPAENPLAEHMAAPAGSEFARGSDLAPAAPAPLGAVAPRVAVSVVAAPLAEAGPAPADPTELPKAQGEVPAALGLVAPAVGPSDLPQPALNDPAATRAAPHGLVQPPLTTARSAETVAGAGVNLSMPPDIGSLQLNHANE